jgi:hypothetical protein
MSFKRFITLISGWLSQIESNRWDRMDNQFGKEQQLLDAKRERTRLGKSRYCSYELVFLTTLSQVIMIRQKLVKTWPKSMPKLDTDLQLEQQGCTTKPIHSILFYV